MKPSIVHTEPEHAVMLDRMAPDPGAVAPLYGRYAKLIHSVASAILGSREEAEDLTQEVFLAAICQPHAYDPDRGTMSAFLVTMTRSRAIDRLRRRSRSARLLETWRPASPPVAPITPFESVSMRRTAERVRAVLAELPPAQREVLEMAYYQGLSQWEISVELGEPLGTVKSRLRRALIRLANALADLTD